MGGVEIAVAVSPKLNHKHKELIENEINKISRLITNSKIATAARSWDDSWKIRNDMNDINIQELQNIINQQHNAARDDTGI